MAQHSPPLAGITVIALEHAIAAPLATRQLADALGICFHVGSQAMSPAAYSEAMQRVRAAIVDAGVTVDVVDVGGGSTELSWVDLKGGETATPPPMRAWLSVPIGVVTLAERFPEGDVPTDGWYRQMVDHVKDQIAAFRRADPMKPSAAPWCVAC